MHLGSNPRRMRAQRRRAFEVDESDGNAMSLIDSGVREPNKSAEPTFPVLTIPRLGIRSSLTECLA